VELVRVVGAGVYDFGGWQGGLEFLGQNVCMCVESQTGRSRGVEVVLRQKIFKKMKNKKLLRNGSNSRPQGTKQSKQSPPPTAGQLYFSISI